MGQHPRQHCLALAQNRQKQERLALACMAGPQGQWSRKNHLGIHCSAMSGEHNTAGGSWQGCHLPEVSLARLQKPQFPRMARKLAGKRLSLRQMLSEAQMLRNRERQIWQAKLARTRTHRSSHCEHCCQSAVSNMPASCRVWVSVRVWVSPHSRSLKHGTGSRKCVASQMRWTAAILWSQYARTAAGRLTAPC